MIPPGLETATLKVLELCKALAEHRYNSKIRRYETIWKPLMDNLQLIHTDYHEVFTQVLARLPAGDETPEDQQRLYEAYVYVREARTKLNALRDRVRAERIQYVASGHQHDYPHGIVARTDFTLEATLRPSEIRFDRAVAWYLDSALWEAGTDHKPSAAPFFGTPMSALEATLDPAESRRIANRSERVGRWRAKNMPSVAPRRLKRALRHVRHVHEGKWRDVCTTHHGLVLDVCGR